MRFGFQNGWFFRWKSLRYWLWIVLGRTWLRLATRFRLSLNIFNFNFYITYLYPFTILIFLKLMFVLLLIFNNLSTNYHNRTLFLMFTIKYRLITVDIYLSRACYSLSWLWFLILFSVYKRQTLNSVMLRGLGTGMFLDMTLIKWRIRVFVEILLSLFYLLWWNWVITYWVSPLHKWSIWNSWLILFMHV
jgi:hypothetical protein